MKNLTPATLLGLSLLIPSCGDDSTPNDPMGEPKPQITEWQTVVDKLAFPTSGDTKITRLNVGRKLYSDNFGNRGDVEVHFDQDSDVITIEMRMYDFSDDATAHGDETNGIVGTFERMSLWAYNDGATPYAPTDADKMDAEKNCQLDAWKDGCSVYVYYDGISQPLRSGADLRVHVPKAWRGELNVQTEDNTNEPTYPRRGNVTITGPGDAGWCSSGSVKMSAGIGKIKLCRGLVPTPLCPADQIEACETAVDMDGNNIAWNSTCGCPADLFGQVRIESLKPWAADITVDIPDTTWLSATVQNTSDNRPHDCTPVLDNCADDGKKCILKDDSTYSKAAEFNYPSPEAPAGAGFNLTVLSAGCTAISHYDDPKDWTADGEAPEDLRGYLKLCTGCLD